MATPQSILHGASTDHSIPHMATSLCAEGSNLAPPEVSHAILHSGAMSVFSKFLRAGCNQVTRVPTATRRGDAPWRAAAFSVLDAILSNKINFPFRHECERFVSRDAWKVVEYLSRLLGLREHPESASTTQEARAHQNTPQNADASLDQVTWDVYQGKNDLLGIYTYLGIRWRHNSKAPETFLYERLTLFRLHR